MNRARSLRVAIVCAAPEFGRFMIHPEVDELRGTIDLTLFCSAGADVSWLREAGYRVVEAPINRKMSPLTDITAIVSLWRHFRSGHFDIVHSYTPKPGLVAQVAALLAGTRIRLHSCRGLLYDSTNMSSVTKFVVRACDWLTFHIATRVIFVSSADRDRAVGLRLCPSARTSIIPNGVNAARFAESATADLCAQWRTGIGVRPQEIIALSVGRFVQDKGYIDIAAAFLKVAANLPQLRLVWIAPSFTGEEEDVSDNPVIRSALATGRVSRLERTDRMEVPYSGADMLIHASYREGRPRVIMEAMMAGLPVIASRIAGNLAVASDLNADTACCFAAGDTDALAESIRAIVATLPQRRADAKRLQSAALAVFSASNVSDAVGSLYGLATLRSASGSC